MFLRVIVVLSVTVFNIVTIIKGTLKHLQHEVKIY